LPTGEEDECILYSSCPISIAIRDDKEPLEGDVALVCTTQHRFLAHSTQSLPSQEPMHHVITTLVPHNFPNCSLGSRPHARSAPCRCLYTSSERSVCHDGGVAIHPQCKALMRHDQRHQEEITHHCPLLNAHGSTSITLNSWAQEQPFLHIKTQNWGDCSRLFHASVLKGDEDARPSSTSFHGVAGSC